MKSLRQQLSALLLTVTSVVILSAVGAFFFVEVYFSRDAAINHLLPLAELVGSSVKPSLALKNPYRAGELLNTLAADDNILAAYLFNQQDQPFAFYKPPQPSHLTLFRRAPEALLEQQELQALLATGTTQCVFRGNYLAILAPVYDDHQKLGTVYLLTHLSRWQQQLFVWLACAVPISGLALGGGILLSRRLQHSVTAPMLRLVDRMERVATGRDFRLHTESDPSAEVATLIDGFNAMLQRLATHEEDLEAINASLAVRVAEKTEDLQQSLREKEFLLNEIHHRVKNNLQIVASLLNLQIKKVHDESALVALQASMSRIRSIALIHEKLYTRGHTLRTDIGEYLQLLSQEVFRLQNLAPERIVLHTEFMSRGVDIDTLMSLALVLNELLTNALKYAFPADRSGVVTVRLIPLEQTGLCLWVEDDGIGMPADVERRKNTSLGLRLAENMLLQRGGSLTIHHRPLGSAIEVRCPLPVTEPPPAPQEGVSA